MKTLSQLKTSLSSRHTLQPVALVFESSAEGLAGISHVIGLITIDARVRSEDLEKAQAVVQCGVRGLGEFTPDDLTITITGLGNADDATLALIARGVDDITVPEAV